MTRSTVAGLIGALVILASVIGAAPPARAETAVFAAQMLPSNQVPPVANADQTAFGLAVVTLTVTRDVSNAITGATADFAVGLTRFPNTDTVVGAHIHQDPVGQNGPIVVDSGISMNSPVSLAGGDTIISRPGLAVSPAIAAQLLSDPTGFYFNVDTSINAEGSVRGQLDTNPAFNAVGLGVFTDAPTYMSGDAIQLKLFVENAGAIALADVFAGVALPAGPGAVPCPAPNDLALVFLGPNNTLDQECLSTLTGPGGHAVPLAQNITLPPIPLTEASVPLSSAMLAMLAGVQGAADVFLCLAMPNTFPGGPMTCGSGGFTLIGSMNMGPGPGY